MLLSQEHGINLSLFSSDVELSGIGFDSFLCSGSEDILGTVYLHSSGVESYCGMDE